MPIEIKELHIKVNIVETPDANSNSSYQLNSLKMNELKSEIVKECTSKVLEKIKEKMER
ncbi:hypothetical protein CLU83_3726 [Flavobacterium sp. 1]|uniref:DUF5908 family protein n=1 Tax=Flavobacterium sp. 1 TaxID=2035200 RepID=UPI000CB5C43C|nr:DUF5908 family protein [Flavobacterium sp. 1]PJJ10323.1 hypothetical protein CLU83_3726 [Flavobacterium sp. 1]